MKIELSNAGKRFNREWIFRNVSLQFQSGNAYAITGLNGSGKSTLLQSIGGLLQLSEGSISFEVDGCSKSIEHSHELISFCAPYLEVIEEMNLNEFLHFHSSFKPFLPGITSTKIISLLGLEYAAEKQIRLYSSGMKQRVKLAQAIFSNTPVILLDEPCTNLDEPGIALYHQLIREYCKERIVIVSSNDHVEYNFCNEILNMSQLRPGQIS